MSDTVSSARKRSAEVDNIKHTPTPGIMLTNDYCGFQPAAGIHRLTERISPDMAPAEFFSEYVGKRRPAVFSGPLVDEQWKGGEWSVAYLSHKAGSTTITAEDRPQPPATTDSSGAGVERSFQEMQYREFVGSLVDGETRYQLTNGDVQCSMSDLRDRNGYLSTVLQPLHALADDFPLRPTILGNLVPHQVALCQGHHNALRCVPSPGLHHYFHDCLYMLLRGRLRFRLFPPTVIPILRSSGCAVKLHCNGLAVYLPTERCKQRAACLRADGVPMVGVARMRRDNAERDLIEAEARLIQLRNAGAENNSEMTEQLEDAKRVMKDCELMVDVTSDELQKFYSDYEDDDDETAAGAGDVISIHDDDSEPDTESLATGSAEPPAVKRSRLSRDEVHTDSDEMTASDVMTMLEYWHANSYSAVHLAQQDTDDANILFASCPQIKHVACLLVDLKAGEMLYLPASWLYEITSIDNESTVSVPHAVSGSSASRSAVDSSETDQPVLAMMGGSAADRDNTADQSAASKVTSVGGATVSDSQSADEAESKNTEAQEEGEETVEGIAGSEARTTTEKVAEGTATDTTNEMPSEADDQLGMNKVDGTEPGCADSSTSSAKNLTNVNDFLALTYLVHPPDGSTFDRPYLDDFWKCRWDRMEAEIRRMLRKSSRLASDVITLDSSSSSSDNYDSSDADFTDYEDSMSPIFVRERKRSAEETEKGDCEDDEDEIVLDENSSNAIVVADDDDDDDDEVICSGGTNEDDKDLDSSIVLCDVDESGVSSLQPSASNCASSVVEMDSEPSQVPAGPFKVPLESSEVPVELSADESGPACSQPSATNCASSAEPSEVPVEPFDVPVEPSAEPLDSAGRANCTGSMVGLDSEPFEIAVNQCSEAGNVQSSSSVDVSSGVIGKTNTVVGECESGSGCDVSAAGDVVSNGTCSVLTADD